MSTKIYKDRRYTDDELSRILGEYDCDNLDTEGSRSWCYGTCLYPSGCIEQVAGNLWDPTCISTAGQHWFDSNYELIRGASVDDFLRELEQAGLA